MSVHYLQVLRDAILENQTEANFVASAGPKALATHNLDELSRHMCPHLRHFVVFSSLTCGHGNAGQTSYAMSNSIMEHICEARVRDGLPGLAVQWGAVGDVGMVAEMQEEHKDIVIGQLCSEIGIIHLDQTSCTQTIDVWLRLNINMF
jgi:fatty acid synthase